MTKWDIVGKVFSITLNLTLACTVFDTIGTVL
jgi:hypothetical protein